jgi:hypothetical protein
LAVGGESSHPPAATSAGLAAAPKDTVSGSCREPTSAWVSGRSAAACTAGLAVVHSSKKASDGPSCAASRCAHAGGASETPPPGVTTGRPAKSLGSWWLTMSVSTCQPCSAADSTTAVFPHPGAPQSRNGTRAAMQRPSASSTAS